MMKNRVDQIVAGTIRYSRLNIVRQQFSRVGAVQHGGGLTSEWGHPVFESTDARLDDTETWEKRRVIVLAMIRIIVKDDVAFDFVVERLFKCTPNHELAAQYGLNPKTARVWVHRVKKQLMG